MEITRPSARRLFIRESSDADLYWKFAMPCSLNGICGTANGSVGASEIICICSGEDTVSCGVLNLRLPPFGITCAVPDMDTVAPRKSMRLFVAPSMQTAARKDPFSCRRTRKLHIGSISSLTMSDTTPFMTTMRLSKVSLCRASGATSVALGIPTLPNCSAFSINALCQL